ncbi:MAG TPA: hypothetical protein VMP11_10735 [Verrucomicrobiae bacterium]|nr:hypothetical protein [Verrucomicrobiae bacterium]
MADIDFSCTACGKSLVIDSAGAGIQVTCPQCGAVVTAPQASPSGTAAFTLSNDPRQRTLLVRGLVLVAIASIVICVWHVVRVVRDERQWASVTAAARGAGDNYEETTRQYQSYLSLFPRGRHSTSAKQFIEVTLPQQIDARDWKRTLDAVGRAHGDPEQILSIYDDYINKHPTDPSLADARILRSGVCDSYVTALLNKAKTATDANDWTTAVTALEKASSLGSASAMYDLGRLYVNGRGGVTDYGKAVGWYRKAAEAGEPQAMFDLGWAYEVGEAVTQDKEKAKEWYQRGAGRGNQRCVESLKRVQQALIEEDESRSRAQKEEQTRQAEEAERKRVAEEAERTRVAEAAQSRADTPVRTDQAPSPQPSSSGFLDWARGLVGSSQPTAKAPMPDDQYFDYLKTKFNNEQDPYKKSAYMLSYLSAYPKGRHMGEALALQEVGDKEPAKAAQEMLNPLLEEYARLESSVEQGITRVDWTRTLVRVKAERKKLDSSKFWSNPELLGTDGLYLKAGIVETDNALMTADMLWARKLKGDEVGAENFGYDISDPEADSKAPVLECIKYYPELKQALYDSRRSFPPWNSTVRFSCDTGTKIMMGIAKQKMQAVRQTAEALHK